MTILQINTVANSGSTGRIAEEIGLLAMQEGMQSFIAYGRWAMPSKSNLIKISSKLDCVWHGIESRIFDNHGLCSKRSTKNFISQIEKINPDIIHLHNIHGYYLNYPILFEYLAKKNIPVVWTLHDCWAFTGHCAYYDFCACDKWKTQCLDCPQKNTYPASFVFDRSAKNYRDKKHCFTMPEKMVTVPVSQWLAGEVADSFLQHYQRKVILNGVDTDVFHPYEQDEMKRKFGWQNKKVLLGVASVWSPRKGFSDYLELAKVLPADYLIVLVGLSDKQQKMLPANMVGIPRTESVEQLAQMYSAADIVLNLSYEETFGMTTVEGFACGTPGIAYNKTASPELFIPGTGHVVAAGNIDLLNEKIRELVKDGKKQYTALCREHALAKYRKQDKFQEYIDLYKNLLAEK